MKAWCDSTAPSGQNPYVWLHSLDGQSIRKKAPENIFIETDFYTIKGGDGSRDLVLEHGLSQLEDQFVRLRREKLSKRKPLSLEDRLTLCAFTAAMQARTKRQRDHWRESWGQALDLMERMIQWSEQASLEERERMASTLRGPHQELDENESLSYEDVKELVDQPMGSLLESTINVVTPFLMSMQLVIMETSSASGFIASDNPCCWFDMEIVKGKSHFRSPGIGSPTIEISLPISPKQLIYLTHHRLVMGEMYFNLDVDTSLVKGFNRRTLMYADKLAVSSRSTPMLKSLITK